MKIRTVIGLANNLLAEAWETELPNKIYGKDISQIRQELSNLICTLETLNVSSLPPYEPWMLELRPIEAIKAYRAKHDLGLRACKIRRDFDMQ
jgi:hypothetical protein